MKKKSIAKLFFMSLLKSLLSIIVILAVGFGSYKISYTLMANDKINVGTTDDEIDDIIQEAQTDDISKNLIYVCNEKGRITNLMLEICNTTTYNMDYVTIPVRTEYTIPATMYQKLCQINPEIPQIVRLSKMKTYFENEKDAFGYSELIIEKMLGVDISYYTVIDQDTYKNHYQKQKVTVSFKQKVDALEGEETSSTQTISTPMNISVASDAYISQIKDLAGDKEKIAEYIKGQYERVNSNLTVYNKIGYIEAYQEMNVDLYHYWGVPATYENKLYVINTKAAKKFINSLIENTTTYTEVQDFTDTNVSSTKAISSKKKSILVLNGSRISGLAGNTQAELIAAGFTVPEVGDYTDDVLTQTRIIVKKEGMGQDLIKYFKDPELVVGTVREGFDIEIILGTADAN